MEKALAKALAKADLRRISLGTSSFHALRMANQIYVDKTLLIHEIACCRDKVFLTRPRRFGKSLLVSAFERLFKYGLEDFKGLAIEKLWTDTVYNAVRLDFSEVRQFSDVQEFRTKFSRLLADQFGLIGFAAESDAPVMSQLSLWLQRQPATSIVCLIDEYDAPLVHCLGNESLFSEVRECLDEFFSVLKSKDECMRFIFITGITKLVNFSGLNSFTDISLNPRYGAILGLTEEEIRSCCGEYLQRAADILKVSCDEAISSLRDCYAGYSFDERASVKVYNPWSVLSFLKQPERGFRHYWCRTGGNPAALTKHMDTQIFRDPECYLRMPRMALSEMDSAVSCKDIRPEVLLTQAGYLTFKNIDDAEIVTLGYPNLEIASSMAQLYAAQLLQSAELRLDARNPDSGTCLFRAIMLTITTSEFYAI